MPTSDAAPAEILLVDDDPASIQLMLRFLQGLGRLRVATRADQALLLALEQAPDLVLLDAEMPGMSGFEVCEALKAEPGLADVPVIFVTAHAEPAFEVAGFAIGAADFIAKPVHAELVRARVQAQLRVKRMADQLRQLSRRDAATGLANRSAFEEALEREWRRAQRDAAPIALLRAQVDGLDGYALRYGDAAAAQALARIGAELARVCARPADLVARWDAAGFALLLPDTGATGAAQQAFHLLEGVEALGIAHADASLADHLTLSLGLSWHEMGAHNGEAPGWSPPALQDAAERALLQALHAGGAQAWQLALGAGLASASELPVALRPSRRR